MTKEELIEYISELINSIKKEKDDILNIRYADLMLVKEQIQNTARDITYLKDLNLEMVDNYINIPMDVINIIMFYQLILKSESYKLDDSQIRYLKYLFNEFSKLISRTTKEKTEEDKDIARINRELYCLNKVINTFHKPQNVTLDDYIIIVKMIKQSNDLSECCDELLNNISRYIKYVMVGNDYKNLYGEKKR